MIAWNSGRFEEAEKLYVQGLAIREKLFGKDDPGNASALNSLALLYNGTDRFGEAEILYRRSLAMREARLGPNHPQVAIVLANLAQMCNTLGRHDEAEKMMLRCLKIRETLGPTHPEIAVALNNLGVMYQQQSRYKEAQPLLERALTINETRFGKEHLEVSVVLNNLAMLHRHNKSPAEALLLLQRALKIQETHYGPDHPNSSITVMNIAMMHRRLGDFVKADEMIERAVKLVQAKKAEPHMAAEWLHQRAELSQAWNRTSDALKWHGQSMALHQTSLRDIFAFGSEASMHAFAETTSTKIPSLVNLAAQAKEDAAATQAFDWTLRLKGVVFDTLCRYRQAQQLLPRDAALQRRVARYRSQKEFLANLALTPPSAKDAERVKKQMADAEQEVTELEKELNRAVSGQMPDLVAGREEITARDVQAKLPADGVLIEFMRTPIRDFKQMEWRHDHYFAFVLPPGKDAPKLIDLGPAKEIDAGVETLRKEFLDFQEKLAECETADEIKTLEKAQEKPFKEKSAALHVGS